MAKAWISDRWLTKAPKMMTDGSTLMVEAPAIVRRSLAMHVNSPDKAQVPVEYRTTEFGRGARWTVFWHADGKRRKRNFREYRAAEEFVAGLEDDIRSGRYVDPAGELHTFAQVAELWLAGLRGTMKGSTEHRYRRELQVWVLARWADVPLGHITTAAIQRWVAQLVEGKAPRDAQRAVSHALSPKTIRSVVKIVMNSVLEHAVNEGWLAVNPIKKVKIPRPVAVVKRVYLVPAEIKALADEMRGEDASSVYILAYTGMRIGELLALRCADVDFERMRIMISKTQSVDVDGRICETLPKGNRTRTVPIPASLLPRLRELTDERGDDEYLVRAPRGGQQSVQNWRNRIWMPALRRAGMNDIKGLVPHSLRHSYASLAIKSGADVKTLQSVLGHASATETLDTYADLWPDRKSDVAAAIDGDIVM
ncbi:tyrosine-type recombinase/integrase [Bifidobacterium sp.]|jgi:integrase|uniref:tyrosine-type recombinase/integrase n=1 Tax=Bifidobacterium sp. TaxID=41200 RepID=UPI0025BF9C36|nr:site-specific integrase [Bifidobacterium sp.]MCI1635855.1 site-specific integrase [Bifidobacterium sp.]